MEEYIEKKRLEHLWLTVRLQECLYAIDCCRVEFIFEITKGITHVPKCHESISGITNARGTILPVIDLRKLFHLKTTEDE
ncbi:chemotaxis protein CheW [Oscillospiraceae bacterium PP1C4]